MVAPIALVDGTFYDIARPEVGYSPPPEVLGHALARIHRWQGQTTLPVCVARHSLLVAAHVRAAGHPVRLQLAALLHDAAEALIGDVAGPCKLLLGDAWSSIERPIQAAIATDYGISIDEIEHQAVVDADRWALVHEADQLMPIDPAELRIATSPVDRAAIDAAASGLVGWVNSTSQRLDGRASVARAWVSAVLLARHRTTTETP